MVIHSLEVRDSLSDDMMAASTPNKEDDERRKDDTDSVCGAEAESDSSSLIHNGSVVSTVPDRYGFLGGAQYSQEDKHGVPPGIVLRRERKWIEMLENWEKYMTKKYRKVRERCRKGVPPSIRPRAWQFLCGAKLMQEQNKHVFAQLVASDGDPKWVDDIRKDIHRQFPLHEMFVNEDGHGQKDLFQVLKAYSVLSPSVGYCQAQAPLAAFLLMHMPAEQAFWCLVSVCDKYLLGYYSCGMETLKVDGEILFNLVKKVAPPVYKHLKKQKIEPILYMTEWFLCVFTRTLPWSSVLRVWDMFLCEGVKIVFKVALVLLKFGLGRPGVLKRCPTMYETLEVLRNLPPNIMDEEFIVHQIQRLNLSEDDFEYEHQRQVARRRAVQENGSHGR